MKEFSVKYDFAAVVLSQINRGSTERRDRRPQLQDLKGSGCIHGDSLIYHIFSNTYMPIRKVYQSKRDFPVETMRAEDETKGLITPSKVWDTGKLHCYRIKTKSGKEIILSKDTKVFNKKWIKVKDLHIGDKIYVYDNKTKRFRFR